jgi:hypothetical protein
MIRDLVKTDELVSPLKSVFCWRPSSRAHTLKESEISDNVLPQVTARTRRLVGYFQRFDTVHAVFSQLNQRIYDATAIRQQIISTASDRIVVHVRCGDYLSPKVQGTHGLSAASYYRTAIDYLSRSTGIRSVQVVSDQPMIALRQLSQALRTTQIKVELAHSRGAWSDLGILANSSAVVMSNSSFSWWGAYLASRYHQSVVVAPKPWYSRETNVETILFDPSWKVIPREIL